MKRAIPIIILYILLATAVGLLGLALKYDDFHGPAHSFRPMEGK